jgi:hypothetical protein
MSSDNNVKKFGSVRQRMARFVDVLGVRRPLYFAVQWILRLKRTTMHLLGISTPQACHARHSEITALWSEFFLRNRDFDLPLSHSANNDIWYAPCCASNYPMMRNLALGWKLTAWGSWGKTCKGVTSTSRKQHSGDCTRTAASTERGKSYAFKFREIFAGMRATASKSGKTNDFDAGWRIGQCTGKGSAVIYEQGAAVFIFSMRSFMR